MNQMLVGLWDVDEHSGEKLERVDRLAVVDIVAGFGLINEETRWRMIPTSGQGDWRAVPVAGDAIEPFGVAGIDPKQRALKCLQTTSISARTRAMVISSTCHD